MDCYGTGLVRMYENDGFVPVAKVLWNPDYRPDDWQGEGKDVYVLMRDSRSTAEVLDDIKNNTTKHLSKEELDALPVMDYEEAMTYRDDLLSEQSVNEQGAFSSALNVENPDETIKLTEQIPYLQERPDGQYVSQTASNSGYNGIASRDEQTRRHVAEKLIDDSMLVTRVSEKESLAKAQADYNADPEGIKKAIMTTEELDGVRTDEAMLILEEERQKALETGDYTEFDKWMRITADRMHKVGQALQALAKYTRTATGTMLSTQKLRDANRESFERRLLTKRKSRRVENSHRH